MSIPLKLLPVRAAGCAQIEMNMQLIARADMLKR
jgi:hypothetical protein